MDTSLSVGCPLWPFPKPSSGRDEWHHLAPDTPDDSPPAWDSEEHSGRVTLMTRVMCSSTDQINMVPNRPWETNTHSTRRSFGTVEGPKTQFRRLRFCLHFGDRLAEMKLKRRPPDMGPGFHRLCAINLKG